MPSLPRLFALGLLCASLAAAVVPWRVGSADLTAEIDAELGRAFGLDATLSGPVTFKLLPRPRIHATGLSIKGRDGSVLVDAPVVKAEFDIPSLLVGHWRLSSATLVEPTVTLDADRLVAGGAAPGAVGRGPALQVRLRSGVVRVRSSTAYADLLATAVDASARWSSAGDDLVLSGTANVRGTSASFAGEVRTDASDETPGSSRASLQVDSPLFTLLADGDLTTGGAPRFAGRLSLATPDVARLLRSVEVGASTGGVRRAAISGDLVADPRGASMSNTSLKLDRMRLDGTLAWRRDRGRGIVAGTLATDLLDVDALLGGGPDRGGLADLYRRRLDPADFATDVDLRVSSATTRFGRVTLTDAAVAALARDGRLELSLDEAAAYGGTVKARAVASLGRDGVEAHADVSATRLDLAGLSDALSGHEHVAGAVSGHAELDGHGASLGDLVGHLGGGGDITVEGARLSGLSLAQALGRVGRRLPFDRRGTPTTFDRAQWRLSVRDGVVSIPDGRLTAPGVAMRFGAETGLPDGNIAVRAVAEPTDAGGAPLRDGPRLPFDLRGRWDGPLVLVGHAGAGLPALSLPIFDGTPPLP